MAVPQVKIKIPTLSFSIKDDMTKKTRMVVAWRTKLVAYARFHKLYDVMFTAAA